MKNKENKQKTKNKMADKPSKVNNYIKCKRSKTPIKRDWQSGVNNITKLYVAYKFI